MRVVIEEWETKNLPALPKCRNFLISVGSFQEVATNCLKTLAQLAKKRMCLVGSQAKSQY